MFVLIVICGLAAGLLASSLLGGTGYGLFGDLAIAVLGALMSALGFGTIDWYAPFGGLVATIIVASFGSAYALIVGRLMYVSGQRAA